MKKQNGFALIEVLIATAILSIVLLSIITGITTGINVITGNKNLTRAVLIAKSRLNEFKLLHMRGPDLENEPVEEYPNFTYSRRIQRFEHEIFGPISANRVEIIVRWKEGENEKKYSLSYIYPSQ